MHLPFTFQGLDLDVGKLSKKGDTPRLVVADENTLFVLADGTKVVCHGSIQEMIITLVMS